MEKAAKANAAPTAAASSVAPSQAPAAATVPTSAAASQSPATVSTEASAAAASQSPASTESSAAASQAPNSIRLIVVIFQLLRLIVVMLLPLFETKEANQRAPLMQGREPNTTSKKSYELDC